MTNPFDPLLNRSSSHANPEYYYFPLFTKLSSYPPRLSLLAVWQDGQKWTDRQQSSRRTVAWCRHSPDFGARGQRETPLEASPLSMWGWQPAASRLGATVELVRTSVFFSHLQNWRGNPPWKDFVEMEKICRKPTVYRRKSESVRHFWLFVTPWIITCQAPLSFGFPRWEYWISPFPSPGDLPDPAIEPASLTLDSLPLSHQGSP